MEHDEIVKDVLNQISSKILYASVGLVGSILISIIAGFSAWTALKSDVAVIRSELKAISRIVESGTSDRYYGSQAERDFALRDQQVIFLQKQIDTLNADLQKHEKLPWHTTAGEHIIRFNEQLNHETNK